MRSLVLVAVAAFPLQGCGSTTAEPARPSTSLTITARWATGAKPLVRTLTCDPAGGTVASPERACEQLAALDEPFAATPPGTACTELYGGPQTARVAGTLDGVAVSTTFARRDGCEVERWSRHAFLFPPGLGGAGPS
jgi:hypothetical protein